MVENIKEVDDTLILAINVGDLSTKKQATIPNYGDVWYDNSAMTNVFSLAAMEDKHQVTYDSAIKSAFIVHTPSGQVKFKRGPENLYYRRPKSHVVHQDVQCIETFKENESFYTLQQIKCAQQACKLLHTLGCQPLLI